MADPAFYQSSDGDKIVQVNKRLEALKLELVAAYQRWEEPEEVKAKYLFFICTSQVLQEEVGQQLKDDMGAEFPFDVSQEIFPVFFF